MSGRNNSMPDKHVGFARFPAEPGYSKSLKDGEILCSMTIANDD
jgi:hypothetical protein